MSSKVNKIGKRNVGKGSLDYCLNRPSSIYPEKVYKYNKKWL